MAQNSVWSPAQCSWWYMTQNDQSVNQSKWTNCLWRLSFVTMGNEFAEGINVSQSYWFRMTWVNDGRFPLKVPWNQNWSFLGVSINMLVLRLSISQCAPKQWPNSHLEDISIQSLQFVTSAKTAQRRFWRHIVLHLLIKLSVQSNAL